mgnify:FL=1
MCKKVQFKICVVTGTRAEYGLLRNLLLKLRDTENVKLDLVVTGSHLSDQFGNTQEEIVKDGFDDYIRIAIPLEDDSKEGMAVSTGIAVQKFAELFRGYKPDIIIVLGDRFEILAAVIAAHIIGISVAHIAGGDVTEGAVDDAIRHCITKMSQLHFPGCEQSAKRIIQMGEEPDRVFNVGEPGVENCLNLKLMSRNELSENLNFAINCHDYSVVTFHPVTMENNTAIEQVYQLIHAMDDQKGMFYIITMANADAGGRVINEIWQKEGKKRENWLVVPSLGVLRYLSAVKYAKLVIGNSSSGVIEVPALGTPTINIGDRQKGRMMAESVIQCDPAQDQITLAIQKGMTPEFQKMAKNIKSPFGDGTTSSQIVQIVLDYLRHKNETNEKHFFDIDFKNFI